MFSVPNALLSSVFTSVLYPIVGFKVTSLNFSMSLGSKSSSDGCSRLELKPLTLTLFYSGKYCISVQIFWTTVYIIKELNTMIQSHTIRRLSILSAFSASTSWKFPNSIHKGTPIIIGMLKPNSIARLRFAFARCLS